MSEVIVSPRLKQVLALMAEGRTAAEIAKAQGITYYTAVTQKEILMRRFGVNKETALIAAAFRKGVLT